MRYYPETGTYHRVFLWAVIILFAANWRAPGADLRELSGHVPPVVHRLVPESRLPATSQMHLAIGVSLSDPVGLQNFVADVSDPGSPNFRHYLTREQLTARFGPTEQDYAAVESYAISNGLSITQTHSDRLLLDVTGPASAVEKAFHVTLWRYRHPTEARDFFAPAVEPSVDSKLRVADVEGLTDYWRPHPRLVRNHASIVPRNAANGSAPDGSGDLFGNDFRTAYVPGTTLTGAGQSVGLLEFDGYYTNDIYLYANQAGGGRTNIVVTPVLLDGYDGTPSSGPDGGEAEVELDIELAMAMAPGLTNIVSFEGGETNGTPNDILDAMLANSNVLNLCCCWGWSGGPSQTIDAIFESMDAVGQSFFSASGDSGAFTPGTGLDNGVDDPSLFNAPSSNPYITQIGGTTLKLKTKSTAWSSEVVWHDSSGGVSSYYLIPTWQTNVPHMVSRGGSILFRNIPDVAANANNVYEIYNNDDLADADDTEGTSCAAPLWAGFAALVNEQSAANGGPVLGFVNPALYVLAAEKSYTNYFHDITSGNNTWSESPDFFYAKVNYDLCTGLGTMRGTNLINALTSPVPPPTSSRPVRNVHGIVLPWRTVPGHSYQLQYITHLGSTNWVNLGPATHAFDKLTSWSDSLTNAPRFYRLILVR